MLFIGYVLNISFLLRFNVTKCNKDILAQWRYNENMAYLITILIQLDIFHLRKCLSDNSAMAISIINNEEI